MHADYGEVSTSAVRWDSCGVQWPDVGAAPILSAKDEVAPMLADFDSPFVFED